LEETLNIPSVAAADEQLLPNTIFFEVGVI
jgi:hypothetical protein